MVAIGIDLGTTYSAVGIWQNDRVEIIANDQGNRVTPSYIAFNDDSQIVQLTATKQYTIEEPHVIVTVTNLGYEYG